MNPYKTAAFRKLQKEWYLILLNNGFDDIEVLSEKFKKKDSSYFAKYYTHLNFKFKEEYYWKAREFLKDYIFDTPIEYRVWELHAEGMPIRDIARRCSTLPCRVHAVIARLKSKMLKGEY